MVFLDYQVFPFTRTSVGTSTIATISGKSLVSVIILDAGTSNSPSAESTVFVENANGSINQDLAIIGPGAIHEIHSCTIENGKVIKVKVNSSSDNIVGELHIFRLPESP